MPFPIHALLSLFHDSSTSLWNISLDCLVGGDGPDEDGQIAGKRVQYIYASAADSSFVHYVGANDEKTEYKTGWTGIVGGQRRDEPKEDGSEHGPKTCKISWELYLSWKQFFAYGTLSLIIQCSLYGLFVCLINFAINYFCCQMTRFFSKILVGRKNAQSAIFSSKGLCVNIASASSKSIVKWTTSCVEDELGRKAYPAVIMGNRRRIETKSILLFVRHFPFMEIATSGIKWFT